MLHINYLLEDFVRKKSGIAIANGILLTLLGLSAFHWTNFYLNRQYQKLLTGAVHSENRGASGVFNLDELLASKIFGSAGEVGTPTKTIPISSLNLKLTGVIASDRGGFALISVNGQPQAPFFVGETVIDNTVLDAVLADRVILLRNGIKESLLLDTDEISSPAAGPLSAPVISRPAQPLSGLVNRIRDGKYQVSRNGLMANVNNPELLRQALIVPNPGGGFVVKNIENGSVFEKLGLRTGDVIRKVNQLDINSMIDVMQLYRLTEDINKIENINIEVERNGNRQQLEYDLR